MQSLKQIHICKISKKKKIFKSETKSHVKYFKPEPRQEKALKSKKPTESLKFGEGKKSNQS